MAKPTTVWFDMTAAVAMTWLWVSIYESFTHTGAWQLIDRVFGHASTLPGLALVLATCVMLGWFAIGGVSWLVWTAVLRDLHPRDFPVARVHTP